MIGWRARLGFLVPPGNPTVETEMNELAPQGVSLHFHRMTARGIGGALDGQRERNQMMIDDLPDSIELLAMVNKLRKQIGQRPITPSTTTMTVKDRGRDLRVQLPEGTSMTLLLHAGDVVSPPPS